MKRSSDVPHRSAWIAALVVVGSGWVVPASALNAGYALGYAATYSDNLARSDEQVPAVDGVRHALDGEVKAFHLGPKLDLDVNLSFNYETTQDAEVDDDFGAYGGLYALWHFVPKQFSWLTANYLSQTSDSLRNFRDPESRSQNNYFITGPVTSLRLTPVDTLGLSLFYIDVYREQDDRDQTRYLGRMNWGHQFSRSRSLALHVDHLQANFDDDADTFSVDNVFARYSLLRGNRQVHLDLGASQYSPDDAVEADSERSTLARVNIRQQLTRTANLSVRASQEYADGTQLEIGDAQSDLVDNLSVSRGVFLQRSFDATLRNRGSSWQNALGVRWRTLDFQNTDEDRDGVTLLASVSVAVGDIDAVTLDATVEQDDYSIRDRQDRELDVALGWRRYLTRRWRAGVTLRHQQLESRGQQVEPDFSENSVTFAIRWQPSARFQALFSQRRQDALNALQ